MSSRLGAYAEVFGGVEARLKAELGKGAKVKSQIENHVEVIKEVLLGSESVCSKPNYKKMSLE